MHFKQSTKYENMHNKMVPNNVMLLGNFVSQTATLILYRTGHSSFN